MTASQRLSRFSGLHLKMSNDQSATKKFVEDRLGAVINSLGARLAQTDGLPVRKSALDIAIPVYNNAQALNDCLNALLPTLSPGDCVWLLDDASKDPGIAPLIQRFIEQWPGSQLIRNKTNCGFVATANQVFRTTHRDLVLLNSDTRVQPGWLEHLQHSMNTNPRAGIVCPISDHASLLSVLPDDSPVNVDLAARVSAGRVLIPTAVGFCMLISRKLIEQAGTFDPVFAPGYGEENDFSMRALRLGFDIQVADQAIVLHHGGGSFGIEQSRALQVEHQKTLDARWPEYRELVQSWWRENPLREKTEYLARPQDGRDSIVHVLHRQYQIGGTERVTRELIRVLSEDYGHTLVYPGRTRNRWCDFEQRPSELCRELMFNNRWVDPETQLAGHGADLSCPHSEQALAKIVLGSGARIVHFHHLLHWDSLLLPSLVKRLGARVVISVHDFYFNCPIHNQLEYFRGQPCGRRFSQPDDRCRACLNSYAGGRNLPGGATAYATGRHAINQHMLSQADAITAPSHFMRNKILQAFDLPDDERLLVIPHGTEIPAHIPKRQTGEKLQVGYFGGDQVLKGASLIVQLARRLSDQAIQFRIYGRVKGFKPGDLPDNVTLCGFYNPNDVGKAMAEIDLTLLPSHYEESFSLVVSESWAHGVPVLSSNRGALRERIVDGVNGWVVTDLALDSWLDAINRLIKEGAIKAVRQRLSGVQVQSTRRSGEAYKALYEELLAATRLEQSIAWPAKRPSRFEHRLRRFRPRYIRKDAHWYLAKTNKIEIERPRCLGIMRDHWGTAQYRLRYPLLELAEAGFSEEPVFHIVKKLGFTVLESCRNAQFTHVFVQPFLSDEGLAMMEDLSRQAGLQVVLVIDDLWTCLPNDNPVHKLMPVDISDRLGYAASLCNQVVVTTATLQRRLGLRHPGLSVVTNALPFSLWEHNMSAEMQKSDTRLRIGWAGAPQHGSDLEFLEPVIRETSGQIDWVFLGMCPQKLRPFAKETHGMLPFAEYPGALAEARLDLAIAPLADNAFNRCKSHLKVLEYGILGIPVIASALDPYQHCPVTLVEGNNPASWIDAINEYLQDSEKRKQRGKALHAWVFENHMMCHRREQWRNILGEYDHAG